MANTYDLQGKTALVTGGARGIGREIASLLVTSGAQVRVWDRRPSHVEGATDDEVDVTDRARVAAALARALEALGQLDILVNCAGVLGRVQPFQSQLADDWAHLVGVNLMGTMCVTQAFLPHMVSAGGGRIVNFSSLAGKEGLAGLAAYSAASGGVIAFTKALAREIAGQGVWVNCIAPGPIDTDMIRDLGPEAVAAMIADSPLKRLGSPNEVAQLAAWLCSDASRFNTGAVFDMSGGRARY